MTVALIWLIGGSGVALFFSFRFTGKKVYGLIGQCLIICSFAIIAVTLIPTTKFWVGIAFAASALYQAVFVIKGVIQRARASAKTAP